MQKIYHIGLLTTLILATIDASAGSREARQERRLARELAAAGTTLPTSEIERLADATAHAPNAANIAKLIVKTYRYLPMSTAGAGSEQAQAFHQQAHAAALRGDAEGAKLAGLKHRLAMIIASAAESRDAVPSVEGITAPPVGHVPLDDTAIRGARDRAVAAHGEASAARDALITAWQARITDLNADLLSNSADHIITLLTSNTDTRQRIMAQDEVYRALNIISRERGAAFNAVMHCPAVQEVRQIAPVTPLPISTNVDTVDHVSLPVVSTPVIDLTSPDVPSSIPSGGESTAQDIPISHHSSFQSIMFDMTSLLTSLQHRLRGDDILEPATTGTSTTLINLTDLHLTSSADVQIEALIQNVPSSTGNRIQVLMNWIRQQEKIDGFMMEPSTLQEILQKAFAAEDIPGEVLEGRLKGYSLLNIYGQLDDILPPNPVAPMLRSIATYIGGSSGSTAETIVSTVPHLPRFAKAHDFEEDPTQ